MKNFMVGLVLLILAGCGSIDRYSNSRLTYVTEFETKFFTTEFNKVKECVGIEAPEPNTAVIEEGYWPFDPAYDGYYDGFSKIIFIKGHSEYIFPHEAIHYLVQKETGDLDEGHKSPFFTNCVAT